jgi:hypothetical protein
MRAVALTVLFALAVPALPAAANTGGLEVVTRGEYSRVVKGMTRVRVERIFDTSGCEYVHYAIGDRVFTGRQYKNPLGNMVAIRYVTGSDGVERVRGKQWDTVKSC